MYEGAFLSPPFFFFDSACQLGICLPQLEFGALSWLNQFDNPLCDGANTGEDGWDLGLRLMAAHFGPVADDANDCRDLVGIFHGERSSGVIRTRVDVGAEATQEIYNGKAFIKGFFFFNMIENKSF